MERQFVLLLKLIVLILKISVLMLKVSDAVHLSNFYLLIRQMIFNNNLLVAVIRQLAIFAIVGIINKLLMNAYLIIMSQEIMSQVLHS